MITDWEQSVTWFQAIEIRELSWWRVTPKMTGWSKKDPEDLAYYFLVERGGQGEASVTIIARTASV